MRVDTLSNRRSSWVRRLAEATLRPSRLILAAVVAALCLGVTGAHAAMKGSCSVGFWAGGRYYTGVVTRSVRTSCPFARRVTTTSLRYIIRHGGAGDGDFYVFDWSPVTHRWYHVHCFANGNLYASEGMHVDCRAGIGARVTYIAHRWS